MKWSKYGDFWGAISVVILILGVLQIPNRTRLGDPDGFYHAKVSQLLQHGQLHDSFPYLVYTTWRDGFADQHFLYHFLLIPFNNVSHLYLSVIFFTSVAFICFYFLLQKFDIKLKAFWIFIAMLGSTDFLFRVNVVKANTISLALLFLLMYMIYQWEEQHYRSSLAAMGIISFLFVWSYGGFVFVPVVLGLYALAILILKRKIIIAPIVTVATGIVLGIVLHPHHANLLMSLYNQIFLTGLGAGKVVPAGNEWLPYNLDWFIRSDVLVLIVWVLGFIVTIFSVVTKKITWLSLWTQLLSLTLLGLALDHRRFIEYFVPFSALASAISLSPYIVKLGWAEIKSALKGWQIVLSVLIINGVLVGFSIYNFRNVYKDLQDGESIYKYQSAAEIMEKASYTGDITINTQWDEFPQLFYWDSINYYPVGMDPTFMYIYDPGLYWKWRIIADQDPSQWQSLAQVHDILAKDLKAKYVFIDADRNPDLPVYLNNDLEHRYFTPIFDQKGVQIFRVN